MNRRGFMDAAAAAVVGLCIPSYFFAPRDGWTTNTPNAADIRRAILMLRDGNLDIQFVEALRYRLHPFTPSGGIVKWGYL